MNVGLDLNGVIFDRSAQREAKAKLLYERHGIFIIQRDVSFENVVGRGRLDAAAYTKIHTETRHIPPALVEGADIYLPLLVSEHAVRIISNGANDDDVAMLRHYGLDVPLVKVAAGKSKAPYCRGLDIFIDNDLPKLSALDDIVPLRVLYIDGGATSKPRQGFATAGSWGGLYRIIQEAA